jgi:hypothetical protein
MDAQQFDTLARTLGSTATRRTALKTLTGGTLAAMIGLRSGDAGAATCRRRQGSCTKGRQCCGHKHGVVCQPLATGSTCASGRRCCGRDGASCPNGNCDCCAGFACNVANFTCVRFP